MKRQPSGTLSSCGRHMLRVQRERVQKDDRPSGAGLEKREAPPGMSSDRSRMVMIVLR